MDAPKGSSRRRYLYAALFFLLMALIIVVRDLVFYDAYNIIWFCDLVLFLFAVAFFMRNIQMVKGLINIGLIAQFIFISEIVMYVFFGVSLSSMPSTLLRTNPINIVLSIMIHLSSTNLALLLTYQRKTRRVSLLYSFLALLLLFVLSLAFTPATDNINYVFSSAFLFGLAIPFYTILWPLLAFAIVVMPTYWFQKKLYLISKSHQALRPSRSDR